jgi:hypothetical protein
MADVVYWVQDLLFVSKIREVAQQLQLAAAPVRDADALVASAREARLVIVDLRLPAALDALERLPRELPKVGFIDHERTDVMERAQALGCRALAKGAFSKELPRLMGDLA